MTKRRAIAAAMIAATAATSFTLALGFKIKDRCLDHEWNGYQYRTSCYNDIYALYFFRGFNHHVFPYIHGDGILENESDASGGKTEIGDLEYPVLTGIYIGVIAQRARDGASFFRLNALGLAVFGLIVIVCVTLVARDRRRVFFVALSPALALYAFHNWDLFAVALMCSGVLAFRHRWDRTAATLIGAGAAAKVFPALILPALIFTRWRAGDRTGARRLVFWASGAFIAINAPIFFIDSRGWWLPWRFQSTRFPNFETWGYMIFRHLGGHFGGFWNDRWPSLTSALAAFSFAAIAFLLVRAAARSRDARPYALSFQLLLAFLLTGKVYSPQYALWVLPFFALVEMPWYAFVAFTVTDAAVWAAISSYFLATTGAGDPGLRMLLLEIAVWVRYAVLVWLIWLVRSRPENVDEEPPNVPIDVIPAEAAAA